MSKALHIHELDVNHEKKSGFVTVLACMLALAVMLVVTFPRHDGAADAAAEPFISLAGR